MGTTPAVLLLRKREGGRDGGDGGKDWTGMNRYPQRDETLLSILFYCDEMILAQFISWFVKVFYFFI